MTLTLLLAAALTAPIAAQTALPGWSSDPAMTFTVSGPSTSFPGDTLAITATVSDKDTHKNVVVTNPDVGIGYNIPNGLFTTSVSGATDYSDPSSFTIRWTGTVSSAYGDYNCAFSGVDQASDLVDDTKYGFLKVSIRPLA